MSNSASLEADLQRIIYLIRTGDSQTAKSLLRNIIKDHPENAKAWYLASLLTDQREQQINALERAVQRDPHFQPAAVQLAKLRLNTPRPIPPSTARPIITPLATSFDAKPATPSRKQSSLPRVWIGILALAVLILFFVINFWPPKPASTPVSQSIPTQSPVAGVSPSSEATRAITMPKATSSLTPTSKPTQTPNALDLVPTLDTAIHALDYRVVDAEYSLSLDRIVTISDTPAALHIYDPEKNQDIAVNLSRAPLCISISPNGKFAAVGHDAAISYIDLQKAAVIKTLDVSTTVSDVVATDDGWIYAMPQTDQWEPLHILNIKTNNETLTSEGTVYAGGMIKLGPNAMGVYYVDRNISPAHIKRLVFGDNGKLEHTFDWPYHGTYVPCNNIWFSGDGKRIFGGCGSVFRVSTDPKQDMTYNGSLEGLSSVISAAHSPKENKILALGFFKDLAGQSITQPVTVLAFFDYDNLSFVTRLKLPVWGGSPSTQKPASGRFIFINAAGDRYYVILQASQDSGLLNDFGVIGGSIATDSATAASRQSPATAGPLVSPTSAPTKTVSTAAAQSGITTPIALTTQTAQAQSPQHDLDRLNFEVTAAQYSKALDRIIMVSTDPRSLHIYDPETGQDTMIQLSRAPNCLNLSVDGLKAIVGHDALISIVDLKQAKITQTLDVSARVISVALGNTGWAYVKSEGDADQIFGLELQTGQVQKLPINTGYYLGSMKITADGQSLYYAVRGVSPAHIQKFDISKGP